LQLVEERKLLLLLLRVLGDLLALALEVRLRDLGRGALGEEGAGCHRKGRGDRPGKSGGEHEARAAGGAGDAGHDPEDRRKPVVGAVDRARDPAAALLVPGLAIENAGEALLRARGGNRGHVAVATAI